MSKAEKKLAIWNAQIVTRALVDSFKKLNPITMMKNPVMLVVEVGSVMTTILLIRDMATGAAGIGFALQITLWLWFTVLFANFAEAMAEG
ncbi:MAG: potassium-transporting ATPase subunit B, partial [Acidobacteria bacterium]|nr:potassium-transporting ATPase subunit B [Acidobacteriota bacterium]